MAQARIAIVAHTPPNIYSGGRYLSWMIGEALAAAGYDTYYVTDQRPPCAADFATLPSHAALRLCLTPDFESDLPRRPLDAVILIPGMDRKPDLYAKAYRLARRDDARFVFHNFETPNWFNSLAPQVRDPRLWEHWRTFGSRADAVLSMCAEAQHFARDFYSVDDGAPRFLYVHPSINSAAADRVAPPGRQRRIVVLSRFIQGAHKGSHDLHRVFSDAMRGYTLTLVIGNGSVPPSQWETLQGAAAANGITLELNHALSDEEKFRVIKSAALMIFPSLFEGYGLPPLEASYCGVPCVVFDLPVLREVNGDTLLYCPRGDWEAMRRRIGEFLRGEVGAPPDLRECITPIARFDRYATRLDAAMGEILSHPPRRKPPLPGEESRGVLARLRRWGEAIALNSRSARGAS